MANLEMQDCPVGILRIGINLSQRLSGFHGVTLPYTHTGKSGIDGYIFAMAYHHYRVESVLLEDCRDFAGKHRTSLRAFTHLYIYT